MLRTYTYPLPSSEIRTHRAIDDVFPEAEAEDNRDPSAAHPGRISTLAQTHVPWPPDGPSPALKRARPEDPARHQ